MRIELGSERLTASSRLAGCRVGVVCNPASVDHGFIHVVDRVAALPGVELGAIFGPQHGVHSDAQENMIETAHASDKQRRVPVYSLYSETREPTAAMLEGLDVLVVDLQDVGTRIYTYIYTMANCLIAGRKHGVRVVVCDRPNPIGGTAVEGPMLVPGFESFVGMYPLPMRHGMTIGELARLFNEHFGIGADLEVVPMAGWRREAYHDDTDAPWVLPSPNLPTLDGAIVYPGTVLFEGTNVSEGRGTTRPFELLGAPGVEAEHLAKHLNALTLAGVHFRPAVFEPTFHKHAKARCGGCQVHVLERTAYQPVAAGVALVTAFRTLDPAGFQWRQPPYEYEYDKLPFDILAGNPELREQIESNVPIREIAGSWEAAVEAFQPIREQFLIYE
ncbi:MAG: exo-beta-N-acetylmuramidase NamZ domain-containing protein [Vicinamibacterales bacterium]